MQTTHAYGDPNEQLAPSVAAGLVGISTDTLKRWEKDGRIAATRTPTGHRRFRRGDVEALLTTGQAGGASA